MKAKFSPKLTIYVRYKCRNVSFDLSYKLTKANVNFRNQFLEYTSGEEWQKFIIEVATVGANRYEATVFTDNSLDIEDLLEKANEEAIVGTHERNKIFGESKLAFEKALQFPFDHFLLTESKRYTKAKRQLTNQQAGF